MTTNLQDFFKLSFWCLLYTKANFCYIDNRHFTWLNHDEKYYYFLEAMFKLIIIIIIIIVIIVNLYYF